MKKSTLFVLCIALFSCCCAKKETTYYRTETVDGITVVHNLRMSPEKAFKALDFVEDLSIGVEEGDADYMLYSPEDIDADLDGNIYILDSKDALIKKYDSEGLFIGNIGRKGNGPGEFDHPYHMEMDSFNRIIVADPYQRRFQLMARDGTYIESVRMESYVNALTCGREGLVLIGYGWYDSDGNQEYRLGLLDSEAGGVKDLFSHKQYWPSRLMNDQIRYDFPYFVRAALDSKNRIFVGVAIDYEISVLSREGELKFKFSKAHDKIPVKEEMLKQITNMTLKGPNPYVKNPFFPVFESFAIDEEDNIWIQHYLPRTVGQTNKETVYDVFSPEGIFQFTTKLPGHIFVPLKFKNGYIYALQVEESGFLKAVRLRYRK